MDDYMDRVGDAYEKYSINPNTKNLKMLQDLTGRTELPDVLDATDILVQGANHVKPLEKLDLAVKRLDSERRILLDKRIQAQANLRINGKAVCKQLATLRESIGLRIRHLTRADDNQRRVQSQIFGLCCRRYQEKIEARATKILGPSTYEIACDPEFLEDAKDFNKISLLTDPQAKLAFFQDHIHQLQDKYLPGHVIPERLVQLIIIMLTHADNPQLLHDIEDVSRCIPKQPSLVGGLLEVANLAVGMIQQEALPDLSRELSE